MNELIIPPSPNWYNGNVLVCTPEQHVVYASRRDIVILHPAPSTEAAEITIIHNAHDERVNAVNANLMTWGNSNRRLVSVSEDKFVKVWNFDNLTCETQHNDHEKYESSIVSASFAGERVISVAENGLIIVWQLIENKRRFLNNIFGMKVKVLCMAICPHAVHLSAFGLSSGLVVVTDLRQSGKIIYKLREHDHDITGLSWCPTPYNIYKTKSGMQVMNTIKKKKIVVKEPAVVSVKEQNSSACDNIEVNVENSNIENSEIHDTQELPSVVDNKVCIANNDFMCDNNTNSEMLYPTREKPVVDRKNPWGNVVFNDSDEEDEEQKDLGKAIDDPVKPVDFLTECLLLQKKISNVENTNSEILDAIVYEKPLAIETDLETKQNKPKSDFEVNEIHSETCEDLENIVEHSKLAEKDENECKIKNSSDYVFDLTLVNSDESKDYLLASACRAGTICIWRAGSDGHLQIKLPKHLKSNHSNKKKDNRQNWISVCWAQPTLILTSSIWHELLIWDLIPKPNKEMQFQIKSSLVHADHKKHIFAIVVPFYLFDRPELENWRNNEDFCVWTSSQDRWLLCTKLSTRCNVACYSTFGGNITCMCVSRLDPNKLAFAVGDGAIHIWDLSRPHKQNIITNVLHDKVHTKVSCIDWHPTRENIFTFSTTDGRVGEYNLTNRSKIVTIYCNYHRSTVHKVQWGPLPKDVEDKYGVYSCSLGELIVHDALKPNKEPYQLAIFDDEFVTNFAWKTDFTVLAVGSRTGSIKILNKQFQLMQTLYMQKKSVRCLEWHPMATACETGVSEFANHLAVSTKENDIYIYDLNKSCIGDNKIQHIVLSGHENYVKNLSWCPQLNQRLVSSDEDGISIVWDIKTKTKLSVFTHSYDNGPSVLWSPFDADLIISGGKLMQIWRITKNPPVFPKTHKKHNNIVKNVIKVVPIENKVHSPENERKRLPKDKEKKTILCVSRKMIFNTENSTSFCRRLLQNKTCVSKDNKVINQMESSDSDEFEDAKNDTDNYLENSLDPVQLFGNRRDVISVLDHEQKYHLDRKGFYDHGMISLWKGDLSSTIKAAIESNNITPWIITMAPMVSHKVWLEVCEKYAKILEDKEEYLEASSYYLICHKIIEANNALCKGHFYKEAFILTKLRLPEENEIMTRVLESWARFNIENGNYEIVAMIYIHMDKYLEAAEILNKRSNLDTLKLAADLAHRCTDKDLINTIISKINDIEENKIEKETSGINICESRLQALLLKEQRQDFSNGIDE